MHDASPRKIHLKDYTLPDYLVNAVELHFNLQDGGTIVTAELHIQRNPDSGNQAAALRLEGEELELLYVELDGEKLADNAYEQDDEGLTVFQVPAQFILRTEVRIYPENNTALEGLYLSSGNYCTQCEAQGFRKITYYPDRPDVMAVFTVTVEADEKKYPVLLSNGNPVVQGKTESGRHWVRWQDPFAKPSYLFALVAGDLALSQGTFTTASGREVALHIYTEHHNADKTAHALRSLQRSMQWDETTFGLEYDLDIYMIVAVDDFNMGAMENKGLNVFNSKFVLALPETATDTDFVNIEAVIGHEYFHNWTGNRVTCRDWFQLSLKEGLTVFRDQSFTADMTSAAVKRIDDVRALRSIQFPEDAGPMAHPVRPDSYIEINNFYTVTVYEKGAEVVRLYQTLLGKDGFRKGMDLYFERHDGQAVTTDDFRNAMADANEVDLSQLQRWYDQAGTPLVDVTADWDASAGEYTLQFSQSCPPTPEATEKKPFLIPIKTGLLGKEGAALPLQLKQGEAAVAGDTITLPLQESTQTFVFSGLTEQPLPSLLREFSAPVQLNFDYTDEQLAFLLAHDSDSFNRWEAGQQLAVNVLLNRIDALRQGREPQMNPHLLGAFEMLLQDTLGDAALLAEALTLPAERYLGELVEVIEPDLIHQAREGLLSALAQALLPQWRALYEAEKPQGVFELSNTAMGSRRLRAVALRYLVSSGDPEALQLAVDQFEQADNMTDSINAMSPLMAVGCPQRQAVLDAFEQRWQDDTLVMDKWFSLQAMSALPDVLQQVKTLMQHSLFSMKNPNKVRALIGAFAAGNQPGFHAIDGSGYRFLGERIQELNELNPQVAARMAKIFTTWRRYDEQRQGLMRAELEALQRIPELSRDVYEIVSRSLET